MALKTSCARHGGQLDAPAVVRRVATCGGKPKAGPGRRRREELVEVDDLKAELRQAGGVAFRESADASGHAREVSRGGHSEAQRTEENLSRAARDIDAQACAGLRRVHGVHVRFETKAG